MPTYHIPRTIQERTESLQKCFATSETVAPADRLITSDTKTRLDDFLSRWTPKVNLVGSTLAQQALPTTNFKKSQEKTVQRTGFFYSGLNNGIKIGDIDRSARPNFGLALDDANIPKMGKEADVLLWAGRAISGEALRLAVAGTVAIGNPGSAAQVQTDLTDMAAKKAIQIPLLIAHDNAQKDLEDMLEEADLLLADIKADIYFKLRHETKPSLRRIARLWGLVFRPTKGDTAVRVELLGESNLHIAGHFTVSDGFSGDIDDSGIKYYSEEDGLLVGDYMVTFSSPGYDNQTVPIKIEKGKITKVKVTLVKFPMPPIV